MQDCISKQYSIDHQKHKQVARLAALTGLHSIRSKRAHQPRLQLLLSALEDHNQFIELQLQAIYKCNLCLLLYGLHALTYTLSWRATFCWSMCRLH